MIRYISRAVSYVQYMTAKPIKHGIKVSCFWCAVSVVLLSFKSYVGKLEEDLDKLVRGVCNNLVIDAGLTTTRGWVL